MPCQKCKIGSDRTRVQNNKKYVSEAFNILFMASF